MIIIGAVAVKIDLARKKGIIISVRVVLVLAVRRIIVARSLLVLRGCKFDWTSAKQNPLEVINRDFI